MDTTMKVTPTGKLLFVVEGLESHYTVDLEQYSLSGRCDCPHFRCKIEPTIKEGEKSKELMRCKHINAVRNYLLDEMILPNLAKNK